MNTDHGLTNEEIRNIAEEFGIKYESLLDPDLKLAGELAVEGNRLCSYLIERVRISTTNTV